MKILCACLRMNPYMIWSDWQLYISNIKFNKVIAVTRKIIKHIDRYIKADNTDNIDFYYYDLPYVLRFWKRGSRGSFLYYNLWQFFLPYILKNNIKFDIFSTLTFIVFPSSMANPKPFIW